MVNNDRIVPIQKIDYLSMIGTVLTIANVSFSTLAATSIEGDFSISEQGEGSMPTYLANQPVRTLDFGENVTKGTIYFVAAYDYAGFTMNGAAATIDDSSVTVSPDGITLYKAVLFSNSVTISAVTPSIVIA